MKKTKKGKIPSLLSGSSGKPKKLQIKQKTICRRCDEEMGKGSFCFGIPNYSSGFKVYKKYCQTCYKDILSQTERELDQLKNEL